MRIPVPPCKINPDTLVHEVELPGELLDRAARTPKQPIMYNKENIYLTYCR
jgi:hypothetical protein